MAARHVAASDPIAVVVQSLVLTSWWLESYVEGSVDALRSGDAGEQQAEGTQRELYTETPPWPQGT